MEGWWRSALTGWILTILPWGICHGQSIVHHDSLKLPLNNWFSESGKSPLRFMYTPRVEYNATAGLSLYINSSEPSGRNNISLSQTLRYVCYISKQGKINISNTVFHRLGLRSFFDSITEISFDENILNTRLEVRLHHRISVAAESEISTRIFNRYLCSVTDSSHSTRYLDAGFLTPMTWNLSAGITFPVKGYGSLLMGITGAKLTFVRDRRVFENPMVTSFYGVTPGHDHLFEYGMSMKLMIDRRFLKICRWYCDLLLFKAYHQPSDMQLKSLFEVRISRYWVLSVQTRIIYEHEVCPNIQLENLASFGFSFRL